MRRTPRFRGHPLAHLPWWIVAHVLAVAALELRHPVAFVVEVIADDAARDHDAAPGECGQDVAIAQASMPTPPRSAINRIAGSETNSLW